MGFLADKTATILFMAGVLLVVLVLLRRSTRALSERSSAFRRREAPHVAPPPATTPHNLEAPRGAVDWEVQMHELMRDMVGQLDSKMRALQHLMRSADEQLLRLETALRRAAAVEVGDAPLNARPSQPSAPPLWEPPTRFDAGTELDAAQSQAAQSQGATATSTSGDGLGAAQATPRHREIHALADAGYSAAAIAHRTGRPIGEVELILSLRSSA